MVSLIKADTLVREVLALADSNPSYVYCPPPRTGRRQYAHGDTPGCLFGYALARLGVPLYRLTAYEGRTISEVLRGLGVQVPERLHQPLAEVQRRQDLQVPWGEATRALRDAQRGHTTGQRGSGSR